MIGGEGPLDPRARRTVRRDRGAADGGGEGRDGKLPRPDAPSAEPPADARGRQAPSGRAPRRPAEGSGEAEAGSAPAPGLVRRPRGAAGPKPVPVAPAPRPGDAADGDRPGRASTPGPDRPPPASPPHRRHGAADGTASPRERPRGDTVSPDSKADPAGRAHEPGTTPPDAGTAARRTGQGAHRRKEAAAQTPPAATSRDEGGAGRLPSGRKLPQEATGSPPPRGVERSAPEPGHEPRRGAAGDDDRRAGRQPAAGREVAGADRLAKRGGEAPQVDRRAGDRADDDAAAGAGRSPRGRLRPRRLALGRSGGDEDAPPPDDRQDRFVRRRELRRTARARRSALPAAGPQEEPHDAPRGPPREEPAKAMPETASAQTFAARADPASEAEAGEPAPAPAEPDAPDAMTDQPPAEPGEAADPAARRLGAAPPRARGIADPEADALPAEGPVVAPDSVTGRSLAVVVAIMTFLCALLTGGVLLIDRAADAWGASVMDEVSVTVLPQDGAPVERRLDAVADILRGTAGVGTVTVLPPDQSEALLRPWLGDGVDLSLLPVPRLVVAERTARIDTAALRRALATVPGASLDDHAGWSERLSAMASAVAGGATAALLLMLLATAISVVFATRATIASNAATVEVLHILGAEERFIVRAFRRRFLATGVRGALAGLVAAAVIFGALEAWSAFFATASPQARALFGSPSIGLAGFLAIAAVAAVVAGLVAVTSTLAVRRHLDHLSP